MKIYLAGPMTGHPNYNYDAFHAEAERLRATGYEVLNPAEHFGGRQDLSYETYMREALKALLECEGIWTLPGWAGSRGAKFEMLVAQRLGLPHLNAREVNPLTELDVFLTVKPKPPIRVEDGRVAHG